MEIELKLPLMDKGFGVEIFGQPQNFGAQFLSLSEVKKAKGFLQCNGEGYCFIEFWTDDESAILNAILAIQRKIELEFRSN